MNNEIQRLHFELKRLNQRVDKLRDQLIALQPRLPKPIIEQAKEVQKTLEENLHG